MCTAQSTGPVDVVRNGETGVLDEDLGKAVRAALALDGRVCRDYAIANSWQQATECFAGYLVDNRKSSTEDVAPDESDDEEEEEGFAAQISVAAEES